VKIFTPKELNDIPQKLINMRELSSGYFKVACELRDKAHSKEKNIRHHQYVFPAVIMYVSSIEAYLNENLWLSSALIDNNEMKEKINNIKEGFGEYRTFRSRVKAIFEIYNKEGIDTNGETYQNFIALVELRNSAAHYNPIFVEHVEWPHRLEKALQQSKIEVMNTGWVSNFSNPAVAIWAYETTKSMVQLFCSVSGAINPFNCSEEHESYKWE